MASHTLCLTGSRRINAHANGDQLLMELLRDYWEIIIAGVALVAWSIRLEAKANENSKEIRRIWVQRREDLDSARESREATNTMLAEVRNDIKTILSRLGK